MSVTIEPLPITAEEYRRSVETGRVTELVRGKIVETHEPFTSHGYYCCQIAVILSQFVRQHEPGRIVTNDAGVVTQRDPDTVRGPDVAFYSYHRVPRGPLPEGYWQVSPELVIEVRSPDDRWNEILQKTAEYLNANVTTVAIVDPEKKRVHLFSSDREAVILNDADSLEFSDVLPGFSVIVGQLFE